MAINADFVREVAPEFADLTDSVIDFWIEQAVLSINVDVWGDKADFATGLMTAHYLTIRARRGAGGPIRSEKVGDLKIEYGNNDGESLDALDSTSYGQNFKQMRRSLVITPRVIGSCLVQ